MMSLVLFAKQNSMLYTEFSNLYLNRNFFTFLAFHFIMLENGKCHSFLADDHLALDFSDDRLNVSYERYPLPVKWS